MLIFKIGARLMRGKLYLSLLIVSIVGCGGGDEGIETGSGVLTVPESPGVVRTYEGSGLVSVAWDPVLSASTYNVYYNDRGNVSLSDDKVSVDALFWVYAGSGSTYCFVVTAVNATGESVPSNEVCAAASSFKLPDTGQTRSFTGYYGEDSDYTTNSILVSDNQDGTFTDSNTNLVWYVADSVGTWKDANDYCEALQWGGFSDWRLPSVREILFSVDYSATDSYFIWSSTHDAFNDLFAWVAGAPGGSAFVNEISNIAGIRCVRGGLLTGNTLFDNENGTITDLSTGLMWQQFFDYRQYFDQALDYCENLDLAGHRDWRLPDIKQLVSLVDHERYWPAFRTEFFPYPETLPQPTFWSSTSDASSQAYRLVWRVDFDIGSVRSMEEACFQPWTGYVRCVRPIN